MKKKMRILITAGILFFTLLSKSENSLFLCTGYDNDGTYYNAYDTWTIHKAGNFMYMMYQSDTPINDTLYISIEKTFNRRDTNYCPYDHYYLVPDVSKNWAVNKYTFSSPGKYKISVFDRGTETLLKSYFTSIDFAEGEYNSGAAIDTWYYNTSQVAFCDSIAGDAQLIGEKNTFKYNPDGNNITLYVGQKNKMSLATDHLYVRVSALNDKHIIQPFSSYIQRQWYWTFVPIHLKEKGKYLVEVYSENDVFINNGILEIR